MRVDCVAKPSLMADCIGWIETLVQLSPFIEKLSGKYLPQCSTHQQASVITARCTMVQSTVLRSHVVLL